MDSPFRLQYAMHFYTKRKQFYDIYSQSNDIVNYVF